MTSQDNDIIFESLIGKFNQNSLRVNFWCKTSYMHNVKSILDQHNKSLSSSIMNSPKSKFFNEKLTILVTFIIYVDQLNSFMTEYPSPLRNKSNLKHKSVGMDRSLSPICNHTSKASK